jgi:hypothetical protein
MGPSYFLLLFLAGCSNPEPLRLINPATLEEIPAVHAVEVSPAKETRKRQIIHILNWHFVPRADFALDIRTEAEKAGVTLSDDDVDRNWESFLGEVEAVQDEQMAVLRELAKSYGLKQVFIEGLAKENQQAFKELLGHLSRWRKPRGESPLENLLIDIHRNNTLDVGAVGRLMMTGESEALPAENKKVMEAANPVKDGKVEFDEAAIERREDAIVRNVLASESPVVVLMLGGSHDLGDNVPGDVEVVRVQVKSHRKSVGNAIESAPE